MASSPPQHADIAALQRQIRRSIRGEVRFTHGDRALYATDSSNYRQVPVGVVVPRDVDDVVAAVEACRQYGVPVLPRGAGTSLAGQTCNAAVVIDMSKYMNSVLEIDPERRIARVQPGVVLDDLRDAAERYNLTYGPDPATHNRCTLGGMIGNNSCGVHSVMAGMTDENVEELEILTYDGLRLRVGATPEDELEAAIAGVGRRGQIYSALKRLRDRYAPHIRNGYPHIPRRVSGYNLPALLPECGFQVAQALVGTEGTCVTVLEATVRLVQSPQQRVLLVLGYENIYTGCDHVPELLRHRPIGLEGFDDYLVGDMRKKGMERADLSLLPPGKGWLLVEFGADSLEEAEAQARGLMKELRGAKGAPSMHLFTERSEQATIWHVRESALGATAIVPGEPPTWPGWEDSAVPPDRMGDYLRDLRALIDRYDYNAAFYGHFGQGCLHTRIDFDFFTKPGIARFRSFIEEAADLVVGYGGSLSGEHGDGQARAELLPKMFGRELIRAFGEFKAIWDPGNKMNPGKVVDPYRIDQNLRLAEYKPAQVQTHFAFAKDNGDFAQAATRCVGVGKCRRHDGGTMCPSYMVTREEADSTRGRARLLWEMLHGSPLEEGWRSEAVREALDLCLACKGCLGECPVQVDMATYKAEFLSHYYAGRPRPITGYSIGLIYWWARLAALMPRAVNTVTQSSLLAPALKRLGGIAPQRRIPAFAPQTFTAWFGKRPGAGSAPKGQVILWPDTFNNHFHPETARAAVEVLEAAGYEVTLPDRPLCCGRPLYDFGFLDGAKSLLLEILEALRPQIRAGVPLIGLEPSCVSVFRDEMVELLPDDADARRLKEQSFLLSEFLVKEGYTPPQLERTAIVHGHCHHKAVMGMGDEEKLLREMGLEARVLDSGCCGMAGAFGFQRDHYDVSIACGERVLLPAVRDAADDAIVLADGFSCREQIAQTTNRQALHLAQVLQMALQETPLEPYPERRYMQDDTARLPLAPLVGAILLGGAAVALRMRRLARGGVGPETPYSPS